jgi:hypothetical protein
MAKGKRQNSNGLTIAICRLPFEFAFAPGRGEARSDSRVDQLWRNLN